MANHIATMNNNSMNMSIFRKVGEYKNIDGKIHACGAVGCIIGHSIVLDPEVDEISMQADASYTKWSERFTGLSSDSHDWQWLFSSEWKYVDNTAIGASNRIKHFVEHGLPENWIKQMRGIDKLCYNSVP